MLAACQTIDRFDRSRPFGPWLRGIAGKLVLAHRRKSATAILVCNETMLVTVHEPQKHSEKLSRTVQTTNSIVAKNTLVVNHLAP
jgi:RNA polymerase sigma-70 factor (ECF subfamily)